jgi:hypothetical protein
MCILEAVQRGQIRDLLKDLFKLAVALSGILLPVLGIILAYEAIRWLWR